MNTDGALRLLKNAGYHITGTDGSFIYIEDPSCILRGFETFIEYAWIAISAITGMLLFAWAISLIRGVKNDIMTNVRNLIIICGTLSLAMPIVNLVFGGDMVARGCQTIRISHNDIIDLLNRRHARLSPRGDTELYESIDITDTGPVTANIDISIHTQRPSTSMPVVSNTSPTIPDTTQWGTAVSARQQNNDVIYTTADGRQLRRTGGTNAWRNQNPGNIRDSAFTRRMGAIGAANGFAVFPNLDTGLRAMGALLRGGTYRELTIKDAIARYSPPTENDTNNYQRRVTEFSGLDLGLRIRDLSDDQFLALLNAMRRIEGWTPGREIPL